MSPSMRIAEVETFAAYNSVFVRLTTESGLVGIGESTAFAFPLAVVEVVNSLRDYLVGADAMDVEAHWLRIYRALGCKGLSRVDMFLTDDGRVVLNEVNTMPGMTSYSRFPRMMAAAGLPLSDVIDRLLALTLHGKKR